MKNKYFSLILFNLILLYTIVRYNFGILSYLGVYMIITIHELGHYIFCMFEGGDPKLNISSGGNFCIQYDKERESILIISGGLIFNLMFLPIFVGMKIFEMGPLPMILLFIGGSFADLIKIIRMVRIDT